MFTRQSVPVCVIHLSPACEWVRLIIISYVIAGLHIVGCIRFAEEGLPRAKKGNNSIGIFKLFLCYFGQI